MVCRENCVQKWADKAKTQNKNGLYHRGIDIALMKVSGVKRIYEKDRGTDRQKGKGNDFMYCPRFPESVER